MGVVKTSANEWNRAIGLNKGPTRHGRQRLLSRVGVVDEMLERILLKAAVELVGDDVLLAALAAIVRRKQLEQVWAAAGQDHPMSRNFPRPHLTRKNKNKTNDERRRAVPFIFIILIYSHKMPHEMRHALCSARVNFACQASQYLLLLDHFPHRMGNTPSDNRSHFHFTPFGTTKTNRDRDDWRKQKREPDKLIILSFASSADNV